VPVPDDIAPTILTRLQQPEFDAAIMFTSPGEGVLPAALLCCLAGIPQRLAYSDGSAHRLLTHTLAEPQQSHDPSRRGVIRRHLDLAAAAGCPTTDESPALRVPGSARLRVLRLLSDQRLNVEQPWVVLRAGASPGAAGYPLDDVTRIARRLTAELGCQVVFIGARAERERIQVVRGGMFVPSYSLVGRLSLSDTAALLSLAPLLISDQSQSLALAAASSTPVIDLTGEARPAAVKHARHQPAPPPDAVVAAARRLLRVGPRPMATFDITA
jgi:ADP-heptose:LPS heptosyltransferase